MGFLITLFGRKEKSSSSVAKERLMEVLIHDRVKLPPDTMEQIRREILAVLSKYINVDHDGLEVSITREDGTPHLTANIPILGGDQPDFSQPDDAIMPARKSAAADREKGSRPAPASANPTASTSPVSSTPPAAPTRAQEDGPAPSPPPARKPSPPASAFGPPRKR